MPSRRLCANSEYNFPSACTHLNVEEVHVGVSIEDVGEPRSFPNLGFSNGQPLSWCYELSGAVIVPALGL